MTADVHNESQPDLLVCTSEENIGLSVLRLSKSSGEWRLGKNWSEVSSFYYGSLMTNVNE